MNTTINNTTNVTANETQLQLFQFIMTDGTIATIPASSYMEAVKIAREGCY